MLPRSACWASRRAPHVPVAPSSSYRAPAVEITASCGRRHHQRRQSSSKTSHPPGGPRGAEQAATTATRPSAESPRPQKRKSKDVAASASLKEQENGAFTRLPSVPSTSHLQLGDVHLSSFFSLHRPISISTSIPGRSSTSSFNAIFDPRPTKHKPNEVIYTISNAVSALESATGSKEENDPISTLITNGNQSAQSLDELVKQFRPFNAPPAPMPFDPSKPAQAERGEALSEETVLSQPSQKTFETIITISEATDANGEKTYTASATPIVERKQITKRHPQVPFLARLAQRRAAYRGRHLRNREMLLISVKRIRKLKMKKHKYKKLMRRTRTERRKLGRA